MAIKIGDTCKRGHVIDGDNVQEYLNRGKPHVRCKTCNRTPVKKKQIGDTCKRGHIIAGDNLLVRNMRGQESFTCRECSLEASRRYRKSEKFMNNPKYVKSRERAERIRMEIAAGVRGRAGLQLPVIMKRVEEIDKRILQNPHHPNLLPAIVNVDLDRRGRDALIALSSGLDNNEPLCAGREKEYVDYEFEPTINEAYNMCAGCPLLVQCSRFANASGPDHGVWGGEVWKQGKVKKHD